MKSYLPIITLAVFLASCTTAYKSGQTPDDVYFSPARPQEEYVRVEKNDDRQYRNADDAYRDDRYLYMKIRNRRWSSLNNGYYSYNPDYYYSYNNSIYFSSPWNSNAYWNYYYNPYGANVVVINPKSPAYNKPRIFNLNVFNNPSDNSNKSNKFNRNTQSYNSNNDNNNYRGSGSNAGNFLRNVFSNSGSSNSGSNNNSGFSSPSSSSNNNRSSGSGSSKSAPVRKF